MSDHDLQFLSYRTDKWAECSCGWVSGACGSPFEAAFRWFEHRRSPAAKDAPKAVDPV